MALSNSQYQEIIHNYELRQLQNHRLSEQRTAEINEKVEGYKELSDSIASLSVAHARRLLEGDDSALDGLHQDIQKLSVMKQELLVNAGYPADYLEPVYTCPDCKDTGYLENRQKCHCFKQAVIRFLYEQSGLQKTLETDNFDHLSYDYYEGEALECFHRTVEISKKFIETFDSDYHNLFFYGTVGTGKSFLSSCIARELLESEHSVVYTSAINLFEVLSKSMFDYKNKEDLITYHKELFDCDLLIIDDLGTEYPTNLISSVFFSLLNGRNMARKSTIISTNLSFEDVSNRYSDRSFSRIMQNYIVCKFTGPDIRIIQKTAK